MRVLVVSAPGVGHVFPMVPLTWALRAAGHDVLVATSSDALVVADAGLPVVDVLPGVNIREQFNKIREEDPARFEELSSRRMSDIREMGEFLPVLSRPLLPGVLAAAERFRPDVILQGALGGVGLIAAAKLGVPWVGHGFGFVRTDGVPELFREHMAAEFEEHGVELPERRAYIDVAPPSMLAGEPEGWSMRYVPYNGGGIEPSWLGQTGDRPRVGEPGSHVPIAGHQPHFHPAGRQRRHDPWLPDCRPLTHVPRTPVPFASSVDDTNGTADRFTSERTRRSGWRCRRARAGPRSRRRPRPP